MDTVDRHLQPRLERALERSRVVMLHGARQCGKTTLAQLLVEARGGAYVSLDDEIHRQALLDDPMTYLARQQRPLVIDEVQLGGDRVVRSIKQLVDADTARGRFLLTGSTNFLTVPNISESLAGRIQLFRLWPFSEAELARTRADVIDRWFQGDPGPLPAESLTKADYLELVCRGGYPAVVDSDPDERRDWLQSYVETVVRRDVAQLVDIRKAASLPVLLRWAAALTSNQINVSAAARDLEISHPTAASYLDWLQTVFLLHEIPAWSRSLWPKAARRPKFHLTDTGLAARLLGLGPEALASPTSPATGPLLESFTVNEIIRQLGADPKGRNLWHYRDRQNHEVDLVLEGEDGQVVAVEIKATSSPALSHIDNLRWLRNKLDAVNPGSFVAGILLHTGTHCVSLDDRLHMRPINSLWSD